MDLAAIETELRRATGRKRTMTDVIVPALVERLAVTLGSTAPVPRAGDPMPAGWHTIFCLQAPARGELGADGLAHGNDLIPPVAMQRRMFGGARLTFHAPLIVGEPVTCESEMTDIKTRTAPSGHLAIVTLRHRYLGPAGLAVEEEQEIIHLEPWPPEQAPKPSAGTPAPRSAAAASAPAPTWQRRIDPDPVMLFRFSAVTFNSHRIHYDAPYSAEVEKLPGLIVQGKLIALQLLETVREAAPRARPARFEYRSGRPLYAGPPCALKAVLGDDRRSVSLWAEDAKAQAVTTATLALAEPVGL